MTAHWKAALLIMATIGVLILAISAGPSWIPVWTDSSLNQQIIWELRFPRAMLAFTVGSLLAIAGSWFQTMLGNPLAEPYVLGVAGISATGAIVMLLIFPGYPISLPVGAAIGALSGIAMIRPFARKNPIHLILAGMVLAAFWSAVLALLLTMVPNQTLGPVLSWLMGDLSSSVIPWPWLGAVSCLLLLAGMWLHRSLDALLLGPDHARNLGVDVEKLQIQLLWLASIATALAVSAAGLIGFVGLVVPHAIRLIVGTMHRTLVPLSALGGGILLACADALSRTVIAPIEIPVGIITAFIGVPVFLWLLLRRCP